MVTKVVIDTNVFVSALGFGGTPLAAVVRTFDDDFELLVSQATLDELSRVLSYDHLPVTVNERNQFLSIIRHEATLVRSTPDVSEIEADPDDDMFLECALGGDADYIVSGDDHLLTVQSYRGISILSPAEFLEQLDC